MKNNKPGFEASMGELETIVGRLEANELTLEESLTLFEKGVALAAEGMRILDAGEKRVNDIMRGVELIGGGDEEEL